MPCSVSTARRRQSCTSRRRWLNANDVQAHNGLGVALDLAGQHEAAEAAYRAGLEVAPDSMLLRNNLGLSLALAGRDQESIELLRAVVDEPGAKARNRQNLALAYGLAGDLVAAERIAASTSTRNRFRTTSPITPRSPPSTTGASGPRPSACIRRS